MTPDQLHQKLLGQLHQSFGENPTTSPELQSFLQQVNDSYGEFETKLKLADDQIKLRTEQLIASTSRAYSFLDSLNMGFIMFDVNPEVVLTNVPVQRIFSKTLDDSSLAQSTQQGRTDWTIAVIDSLFQPELQFSNLIKQCLTDNQPIERKEVNFGKRVLHIFIASMLNKDTKGTTQQIGVVTLVEDITEQVVLERAKDEFFSIASHELRTPLTAIRGNASLIKTYYGDKLPDKNTLEMIDDIHESSIRLIDIVNDFLDASALEQGKITMKPELISIQQIVSEVIRELQALCEDKGIRLKNDESVTSLPQVKADKQRVKQVIYNLIGNAVKFTEQGSITISGRLDEQFVYIAVTDTGTGMSVENQRLLFRKFQQAGNSLLTRDTTKGTGLGLYISKLIVERSGGKIWLEYSEQGKGSIFTFSLPLVTDN